LTQKVARTLTKSASAHELAGPPRSPLMKF